MCAKNVCGPGQCFPFSVINVAGLSVTGKDITDIGERNRFLPGRVCNVWFQTYNVQSLVHIFNHQCAAVYRLWTFLWGSFQHVSTAKFVLSPIPLPFFLIVDFKFCCLGTFQSSGEQSWELRIFSPRLSSIWWWRVWILTLLPHVSTCLSPSYGNTGSGFALISLPGKYMF